MSMDYLIECHRSTREEILFRIKHRDTYLKLQLLSQAVLLALSSGVKIAGAEATSSMPFVLTLAIPIAVVFTCLYYRENKLVAHLSNYLSSLPPLTIQIDNQTHTIENWDASDELSKFGKGTVWFRLIAEAIAFVLVPAGLFIRWWQPAWTQPWLKGTVFGVELCLLMLLLVVVGLSFNYLRARPPVRAGEEFQPTSGDGTAVRAAALHGTPQE